MNLRKLLVGLYTLKIRWLILIHKRERLFQECFGAFEAVFGAGSARWPVQAAGGRRAGYRCAAMECGLGFRFEESCGVAHPR
ncbi:hypothetical protein E3N88_15437 [Mikania micrantha]|uniref:Uncharacterized protein n=1 Tax=Mikania micrantha TaxID=192012 RepID=A0A5N6NWT0_9ASTR|nr:hypothetical protein E3N88_15437 [Mikania micrantha]